MFAVTLVALPVALAVAQQDTALRRVVARVPAGAPVQVELGGTRRVIAPIVATMSDGFALRDTAGGTQPVRFGDVTRFWVRKRAIGAGMAVGGVAGAGTGAFFGLLVSGLCDSSDCPSLGQGLLVGGLLGGLTGAAAGAIVGAAIPRWDLAWSSPARGRSSRANTTVAVPAPGTSSEAERRRVGEFTAFAITGYGGFPPDSLIPDQGFMAGVQGALGFRVGRFAFGPEAGILFGEQSNWSLAGVARLDLRDTRSGQLVPYLVGGLGGVFWEMEYLEASLLTASVGLGVTTGARGRLEARWHPVLQNPSVYSPTGQAVNPTLFTVAAGYRFVW